MARSRPVEQVPPGVVWSYAGALAPDGWLFCHGTILSQLDYPELYAVIGSLFNIGGEPEGTFRLPDLRQRFILGKGLTAPGHILGQYGGQIDHKHQVPAHHHEVTEESTLAITGGQHVTSLAHNHGQLTTSGGSPHKHENSFNISAGTPHTHQHTLQTDIQGNHQHSIDHAQLEEESEESILSGEGTAKVLKELKTSNLVSNSCFSGLHSHHLLGNINNESSHTHNIEGDILNESAHIHDVTVPEYTGQSLSNGAHSHNSDDISGIIGKPSSANGNNSIETHAANPPYCALNFIIKA